MRNQIKNIVLISLFGLLGACGPAKENRENWERLSVRIADSLETAIDSAMNEPYKLLLMSENHKPYDTYVFEYKP